MSARIRAARLVERCTRPAVRRFSSLKTTAEKLPLGFLRTPDIDAYVAATYASAPDFYSPDTYRFNHEHGFVAAIRQHAGGNRLLDLYCGQGREAEIFAAAGFAVLGIDRLHSSVEAARKKSAELGSSTRFLCADISSWTPQNRETWDTVYTSLWMLSTVPDSHRRIAWLRRFATWTAPGGVLFASVTTRPPNPSPTTHLLAATTRLASLNPRRIEPGDRLTDGLFWHDFVPGEVEQEAAAAGLSVIASFPFRDDSQAFIFSPIR